MISTKELRIGNFIKHQRMNALRVDTIIFDVHGGYSAIMYPAFPNMESELVLPLNKADGIPVTKELLLKCGFDSNARLEHGDLYFELRGNVVAYGTLDNDYENEVLIDNNSIKYLHQLQNLYFAITNQELKISL